MVHSLKKLVNDIYLAIKNIEEDFEASVFRLLVCRLSVKGSSL